MPNSLITYAPLCNDHYTSSSIDLFEKKLSQRVDLLNYWLSFSAHYHFSLPKKIDQITLHQTLFFIKGSLNYNEKIVYLPFLKESLLLILYKVLQVSFDRFLQEIFSIRKKKPRLTKLVDQFASSCMQSLNFFQESKKIKNVIAVHEFACHIFQQLKEILSAYRRVATLMI